MSGAAIVLVVQLVAQIFLGKPYEAHFRRLVRGIFLSLGLCFQEARAAATPLCMPDVDSPPFASCHVVPLYSGTNGSVVGALGLRLGNRCIMTSSRRMGSWLFLPPCMQLRLCCVCLHDEVDQAPCTGVLILDSIHYTDCTGSELLK